MQEVQQFQRDPEREKPNIFPCLFTLTKHISGTGPLMMSRQGVGSAPETSFVFVPFQRCPKEVAADYKQAAKHAVFSKSYNFTCVSLLGFPEQQLDSQPLPVSNG